jgi:hypothetical protein
MSSQTLLLDDSTRKLVEIRRSSGKKEWVTKETLAELNRQRHIRQAALRAKNDKFLAQKKSKKTNWIAISIWLNAFLLIALLVSLVP